MLIERDSFPAVLKRAPRNFTPDGLVVTRHEARSVDGERIPYVQVGPAKETADAPVHMTGYGGFRSSNLPYYRDGHGTMVGGLAGSVLGTLGLVPIGTAPAPSLSTARAAQPPVAINIECRNITDTMDVDGAKVEVKGLVCKQADGTWKVSP